MPIAQDDAEKDSAIPDKATVTFANGEHFGLWELLKLARQPAAGDTSMNVRAMRMALGRMGWKTRAASGEADAEDSLAALKSEIQNDPMSADPWRRLVRHMAMSGKPAQVKAVIDAARLHGIDSKAAGAEDISGDLAKLESLLECSAEQIDTIWRLRVGLREVEDRVKKKWREVTARLLELQAESRKDFWGYFLYVARTQMSAEDLSRTRFPDHTKRFGLMHVTELHVEIADGFLNERRALIQAPPRHGKTDIVIHGIPWLLANNPDMRIHYATNADAQASKRLGMIRGHFSRTEAMGRRHAALFPNSVIDKSKRDNAGSFTVVRSLSSSEASVSASSLATRITGSGFSLLVMDDILSQHDAVEPATRENNRQLVSNEWLRRLDPGCRAVIIGYPWHEEDATEWIKRNRPDFTQLLFWVGSDFSPLIPAVIDSEIGRAHV